MQSLRDSLSSIPGAVTAAYSTLSYRAPDDPANTSNTSQDQPRSLSSLSSLSGDESEKSHAIPNSLIKEQWQLILGQEATIYELEAAIERCKELVVNSDECSLERKWLVRHLVELRFRLKELQDSIDDPHVSAEFSKVILGHHFVPRNAKTINLSVSKQYCDHCSGIIWSVVQASFICSDCSFCVHFKCVQSVIRVCANVVAAERKYPIEDICPESGLAAQQYKCAECQSPMNFKGNWVEARICDYTGLYYCPTCHWNDAAKIPARIIHNWDFTLHRVCRASLQELNLLNEWPVIYLEQRNPRLFVFVQELSLIKKLREDLMHMRKYLSQCREAANCKILEANIGNQRHLIQSPDMYSLSDLTSIETGLIVDYLHKVFQTFETHIRSCEICTGKGYLCEICSNNEIIFPFDDGSVPCWKCNSVFHRACWMRKNLNCPKCWRIKERKSILEGEQLDIDNGNQIEEQLQDASDSEEAIK